MSFVLTPQISIPLTAAQGGTGLTTLTAGNVILGNGSGSVNLVAPGTTGNLLTSNGNNWVSSSPGGSFSIITSNTNATSGSLYLCDTSAGAFTVTLPSSPSNTNTVYIQDSKGTFNINNLSIDPGSKTIMGASGVLLATQQSVGFGLIYNGTEWRIY